MVQQNKAVKAKQEAEKRYRDNPKFVGASPAQAARAKFLEVLRNDPAADTDGK